MFSQLLSDIGSLWAKYGTVYLTGIANTLILAVTATLIGCIIGFLCGILQTIPYNSNDNIIKRFFLKLIRIIIRIYVEVFRGTPMILQAVFIYYGLPKLGFSVTPRLCGIAGLAFLGGSYMAEAFRSGLESVPVIQSESALSLGMSSSQMIRYVILPQALSTSIPALLANVIFLLKETSVFSAVSLMDLMFTAKDLIGLYYNTTEALFLLVVMYLIILLPISMVGMLLERRLRYAGFGD